MDRKPKEIHTVTASECVPVVKKGQHWDDFHMPCWICNQDNVAKHYELLYNEFSQSYFHRSCIEKRDS